LIRHVDVSVDVLDVFFLGILAVFLVKVLHLPRNERSGDPEGNLRTNLVIDQQTDHIRDRGSEVFW
jgi:hypothetical protein